MKKRIILMSACFALAAGAAFAGKAKGSDSVYQLDGSNNCTEITSCSSTPGAACGVSAPEYYSDNVCSAPTDAFQRP